MGDDPLDLDAIEHRIRQNRAGGEQAYEDGMALVRRVRELEAVMRDVATWNEPGAMSEALLAALNHNT